ncbi:MAG: hypothetical protein Q9226_003067 [Calogaya cf. arnoldii]
MSAERSYMKGEDGKRILLTQAQISEEHVQKTLTLGDHSYTIHIPRNHGAKSNKVIAQVQPFPHGTYLQAIEKDICDRAEGPYNPVIILLTVIFMIDPTMRLCLYWPFANATFVLLLFLYCLSTYTFLTQAIDPNSAVNEDHNHHRLLNSLDQSDTLQDGHLREGSYEPLFAGSDRGIIGRAPEAVTTLANNAPQPMNIEPGDIQYWTFPKSSLQAAYGKPAFDLPLNLSATTNTTCLENDLIQLAKKQNTTATTRNLWLSISVCDQPTSAAAATPPQLEVYLSRSSDNQQPDKERHNQTITVEGGYGYVNLWSVSDDIWVAVRAPQAPNGFEGVYNYELAASIDALYTTYFNGDPKFNDTQITAWDTDSNSSILSTGDITNSLSNTSVFTRWMNMTPPFKVYVHDHADLSFQSLNRSICGLRNHAKVKESDNSMVKIGGQPKQLFYVNKLNRSTSYYAVMTLERGAGNTTAGGGGAVWKATSFTTKSDNNCQIIYNLPFCKDVAYAVPSNPTLHPNVTELGLLYDNYANESYQNFNNTPSRAIAKTAIMPTEPGFAPSASLAAKTSPLPPTTKDTFFPAISTKLSSTDQMCPRNPRASFSAQGTNPQITMASRVIA